MNTQHGEVPNDALDRLRTEIDELRESRRRLVLAADAHCGKIERVLHDGVQQQLVALAVDLQLARPLIDSDPAAARHLLDEMARDVQQALDDAARLSHLIDAPVLDAGGLAVALRSAAVAAGVPASVDAQVTHRCTAEAARTVYWCWHEALDRAKDKAQVAVIVYEVDALLLFEIVGALSGANLDDLRDRVAAFGGTLTDRAEDGGEVRLSGSLPLSQ